MSCELVMKVGMIYNMNLFREFVFKTGFLDLYEIDKETITKIKEDDTSLLELGFAYLGRALFPEHFGAA